MEIRHSRSATKHRVSRERSRHVVLTAETIIAESAPEDSPVPDRRLVFLGDDQNGVTLEVVAIETDDGVLVIHAMKIRAKYRPYFKGHRYD